jgi:hypothetical protein
MFNRKHRMFKHRIAFVGAWLALTIALAAFPGFETRGLAMGLIIGWWPFALLDFMIGDAIHHLHPGVAYAVMFVFSGAAVAACAWVLDKARLSKRVWIVLLLAVTVGPFAVHAVNGFGFEDWKNTPAVSAAMNSPELNYEPTRWDFYKDSVIPRTLVAGMWGLYAAATLGCLYSAAVIIFRKDHPKSQLQAAGH